MKVLLLKDVPNVGHKNDIKEVHDGFARNFLLARKLAVIATDEKIRVVAKEKQSKEKKQQDDQKKYQDIAERLRALEIIITTKVGEKGKAFGSIGSHDIKKALEMQGVHIEEEWIVLEEPIKSTGVKQILVKFPHGVEGSLAVTVKAE